MYERNMDTEIFLEKRWWKKTEGVNGPLNAEERGLEQNLSLITQKQTTLLTLWSRSFSFHIRGTIDFYDFSHSVCGRSSSSPGKPVNPQSISWPLKFSPKKCIQLGVCPHFPQDVLNWNICNHFLIVVYIFPFSLKSKFSFCANAQVFHGVLTLSCSHKLCVKLSVSAHSHQSLLFVSDCCQLSRYEAAS